VAFSVANAIFKSVYDNVPTALFALLLQTFLKMMLILDYGYICLFYFLFLYKGFTQVQNYAVKFAIT
jgi:hypothetical protein